MTNSCFEWNCSTLTLDSIEVKEVNLLHTITSLLLALSATQSFSEVMVIIVQSDLSSPHLLESISMLMLKAVYVVSNSFVTFFGLV